MGCYVNPPGQNKEQWLAQFGRRTTGPEPVTATHCPVCLVDNGLFTAAGVGFCEEEVQAFLYPDGGRQRQRVWFLVPREELRKVSDLSVWEQRYPPPKE